MKENKNPKPDGRSFQETLLTVGVGVYEISKLIRHSFPLPDPANCLRYSLTEAGEAVDAWLRLYRNSDKRNNDRQTSVEAEVGDACRMVYLALFQYDPSPTAVLAVLYQPAYSPKPTLDRFVSAVTELFGAWFGEFAPFPNVESDADDIVGYMVDALVVGFAYLGDDGFKKEIGRSLAKSIRKNYVPALDGVENDGASLASLMPEAERQLAELRGLYAQYFGEELATEEFGQVGDQLNGYFVDLFTVRAFEVVKGWE